MPFLTKVRTRGSCRARQSISALDISSPSSSSPSDSPQVDFQSLDIAPFSDSFPGLFESRKDDDTLSPEMSFEVHNLVKEENHSPHWQDDEIEEIMVIRPKPKVWGMSEIDSGDQNSKSTNGPPAHTRISDFELLSVLGEGMAAKVTLGRKRDTRRLYAVKSMRKTVVLTEGLVKHVESEQATLRLANELRSPFLPCLRWCFQDEARLFLIMDFYPGGDLLTHIARHGFFSAHRARMYACEIVEGLTALHGAGIVHRDLKPENVMIDAEGHIVLTDFGCAKMLDNPQFRIRRTNSACGTRAYQPPEMLLGWAHDFAVDCWGFGLLLYLMLFGRHPFMDQTGPENIAVLRQMILYGPTPFNPARRVEMAARDLIVESLERNPLVRLTIREIREHSYFSSVDWKLVASKGITVPFVPSLDKSRIDLSYFDKEFTELPVDLEYPLWKETDAVPQESGLVSGAFQSFSYAYESKKNAEDVIHEPYQSLRIQPPTFLPSIPRRRNPLDRIRPLSILSTTIEEEEQTSSLVTQGNETIILEDNKTPQNRQAFWDALSLDYPSTSSDGPLSPGSRWLSGHPQPRKLRKMRTSGSLAEIKRHTPLLGRFHKILSRPLTTPAITSTPYPSLSLPEGIEQIGGGIGFTCQNSGEEAARSRVSLCTKKAPGAYFEKFTNVLPAVRHGLRRLGKSHHSVDRDIENNVTALKNPTTSLTETCTSPAIEPSQSPFASPGSTTSLSLQTPDTMDLEFDFTSDMKATEGGPDTTLRLVTPSRTTALGFIL